MLVSAILIQAAFAAPTLPTVIPNVDSQPLPLAQAEESGTWTREADVGITRLEGNTESMNSAFNAIVGWEGGLQRWEVGAHYSSVRQERTPGDSTTTSRLLHYEGRYDMFFSEAKNVYGYAKASDRQNKPTGLEGRTDVGLGLGYLFDITETISAEAEAGVSYVMDQKVGLEEEKAAVFRGAYLVDSPLSEATSLVNSGEYLTGDNIETFSHALGLRWTMDSDMYLQFSYNIEWDNFAATGFESTDRRYVVVFGMSF